MENNILEIRDFNAYYGNSKILYDINVPIEKNKITTIIGPSGCGKTTLLRAVNRMHELNPEARVEGEILLNGENLYNIHPIILRRKIGMVFQKPNPFPHMSIYDNVIAGYKINGIKKKKKEFDSIVKESLKSAGLWEEVKDKLKERGTFLSGGQQQRLCIARAIAMKPEILLLDEPTSALDPIATSNIEKLIIKLKKEVTIIMVTHNIAQAGRISDNTIFLYLGDLVEHGRTEKLFTVPKDIRTNQYLTGKFG